MNISGLSVQIIKHLEESTAINDYEDDVAGLIWNELKELLNAIFKMRKFQKQYFKHKDNRSLEAAKQMERFVDELLDDLKKQKNEPVLKINLK